MEDLVEPTLLQVKEEEEELEIKDKEEEMEIKEEEEEMEIKEEEEEVCIKQKGSDEGSGSSRAPELLPPGLAEPALPPPAAAPAVANALAPRGLAEPAVANALAPRGLAEPALPPPAAPERPKAPEDLRFAPVTPPRSPLAAASVAPALQPGVQPVDAVREPDYNALTGPRRTARPRPQKRKLQPADGVQAATRGRIKAPTGGRRFALKRKLQPAVADPVQAAIHDGVKAQDGASVVIELISAALKLMNDEPVSGHGLTKKERILEKRRLERVNKTHASVLLEASQIMLLIR